MRRATALVLVAVLVVSIWPVPAAAAQVDVSVSTVTVTPQEPVPGEAVTVRATIQSLASSETEFEIETVSLETPEDEPFQRFDRVTDLGSISPGASIEVPMSASFNNPGTKRLRIIVRGEDEFGGDVVVRYPVTLTVRNDHPRVDVGVARPVVGVETTATVTVANGLNRDLRNVVVALDGDLTADRPQRVLSRLGAGESSEVMFTVEPTRKGSNRVVATVEYAFDTGVTRQTEAERSVQVEALRERLVVDARATEAGIEVTLANLGNTVVERILVAGETPDATVGPAIVPALAPTNTTTVVLPVTDAEGETPVAVRASYEIGNRTGAADGGTVTFRSNPGRVEVTGTDVEREGDRLHITGSASNVGLTEVNSVIVRVVPAEGVEPAAPNREYFVGTVPPSDFVSFDVFARADADVTSVPLEVTYLSDGIRYTTQATVPVDATPQEGGDTGEPRGSLVPAAGGAVIILLVGAAMYLAWRNRRVGD